MSDIKFIFFDFIFPAILLGMAICVDPTIAVTILFLSLPFSIFLYSTGVLPYVFVIPGLLLAYLAENFGYEFTTVLAFLCIPSVPLGTIFAKWYYKIED